MITLKTAVFTAEHGYKWTTPPEGITESQLSRYGKIVDQAYREGMGASDYIQGLIYDGSLVAVFSALRTGPGWDTAGRAAKYYALAFIEREQWPQVNFDVLLQNPFFLSPDKNPPAEIVYDGPASAKVDETILPLFANGGKGPERIDFACLGNFLSVHFQLGLNWRFYRSNIQNWHGPELAFEKSLMMGAFMPRASTTTTDEVCPSRNAEKKEVAMSINGSSSDLPSSDIARLTILVKKLRQECDDTRLAVKALASKLTVLASIIGVMAIAIVVLLTLAVLGENPLQKLQRGGDGNDEERPSLQEQLKKAKPAKPNKIGNANTASVSTAAIPESQTNTIEKAK